MIGLDTNVLVRFLVRDDEAQYERARRLIRREAQVGRACVHQPRRVTRGRVGPAQSLSVRQGGDSQAFSRIS